MKRLIAAPVLALAVIAAGASPAQGYLGASPATSLLLAIRTIENPHLVSTPTLTSFARQRVGSFDNHAGFRCSRQFHLCGEILGWTNLTGQPAQAWVMQAWMDSPTHRAVLTMRWTWVGIGVKRIGERTYYAVEFAR